MSCVLLTALLTNPTMDSVPPYRDSTRTIASHTGTARALLRQISRFSEKPDPEGALFPPPSLYLRKDIAGRSSLPSASPPRPTDRAAFSPARVAASSPRPPVMERCQDSESSSLEQPIPEAQEALQESQNVAAFLSVKRPGEQKEGIMMLPGKCVTTVVNGEGVPFICAETRHVN